MVSTPLQKALFEALIFLQGFIAACRAGATSYFFVKFMYLGYDGISFLLEIPITTLLWWILLFTILTQVRLKSQITAHQTLYFEIIKSVIITALAIWFVVRYLMFASRSSGIHLPLGEISILHRVYSSVLFLLFNAGLFYPTLWIGWKGTRQGGISLGEQVESLLPQ